MTISEDYRMTDPICKFNDSKASAINCSEFIYETTDVQSRPIHSTQHHVGLILKGRATLTVNGESHTLTQGDVYFIKKGSVFSLERSDGTEYLYISFSGWHADDLIERLRLSSQRCVFKGSSGILPFWRTCFDRSESGNLDLFSEAVLLYTAAELADSKKSSNGLADRMAEYADGHYGDPSLTLSVIADELGYDKKYLSSLFKAQKKVTFTEYLRTLRIKHSAFLFEEGVESVKSVAILSGFSDALYFSRIFKQETGKSPSEYIKGVERTKKQNTINSN